MNKYVSFEKGDIKEIDDAAKTQMLAEGLLEYSHLDAPSGTINIVTNGTKNVAEYAYAEVNVPASAVVSGTKDITKNNPSEDVTNYALANVYVAATFASFSLTVSGFNSAPYAYGLTSQGSLATISRIPVVGGPVTIYIPQTDSPYPIRIDTNENFTTSGAQGNGQYIVNGSYQKFISVLPNTTVTLTKNS